MNPTAALTLDYLPQAAELDYSAFVARSSARRINGAGAQRSACSFSSRSPMNFDGREPRVPAKYAAMVDWPHGTRSANCC